MLKIFPVADINGKKYFTQIESWAILNTSGQGKGYEMTETIFEKLQNAEYWTHEALCAVNDDDREAIEDCIEILEQMMHKYKNCVS